MTTKQEFLVEGPYGLRFTVPKILEPRVLNTFLFMLFFVPGALIWALVSPYSSCPQGHGSRI